MIAAYDCDPRGNGPLPSLNPSADPSTRTLDQAEYKPLGGKKGVAGKWRSSHASKTIGREMSLRSQHVDGQVF